MAEHWAPLDIAYTHTPTAILISLTTAHLCHLTCYYTFNQPLTHKITRAIRGLDVPWATYFCFNAWLEVEQNEPGDTLIHSFTIPDLVYCQTIHFAFKGTISGVASPSVSPILSRHFVPWLTLELGTTQDTWIWNYNHDFTPGSEPTMNVTYGAYPVLSRADSFLVFDQTPFINKAIVKATLRLYYLRNTSEGKFLTANKVSWNGLDEEYLNSHYFARFSRWVTANHFGAIDYFTSDPTPAEAIIPPFGAPFYVEWDTTTLLADALKHNVNLNIVLRFPAQDSGTMTYRTKEATDPSLRPKLTVVYHEY